MKYRLRLGPRRITATADPFLARLLAIALGQRPDTAPAATGVRQRLQACLDRDADPGRARVNQWLQEQLLERIADPALLRDYYCWFDEAYEESLSTRVPTSPDPRPQASGAARPAAGKNGGNTNP